MIRKIADAKRGQGNPFRMYPGLEIDADEVSTISVDMGGDIQRFKMDCAAECLARKHGGYVVRTIDGKKVASMLGGPSTKDGLFGLKTAGKPTVSGKELEERMRPAEDESTEAYVLVGKLGRTNEVNNATIMQAITRLQKDQERLRGDLFDRIGVMLMEFTGNKSGFKGEKSRRLDDVKDDPATCG
eukprot:gene46616-63608_t